MALDAEVGGAASNSYGSLAEADSFFSDRPEADDWEAVGSQKEAWLIRATDRLEQESYQGERTDDDQALSFPRVGLFIDGIEIDDDVIPVQAKRGQFQLALSLSGEDDPFADTGLEGFKQLEVDVINLVPVEGFEAGDLPADVSREIAPLRGGTSTAQFRVFRG
jgi:hypothetical protein